MGTQQLMLAEVVLLASPWADMDGAAYSEVGLCHGRPVHVLTWQERSVQQRARRCLLKDGAAHQALRAVVLLL